jgi:hypothetical protein
MKVVRFCIILLASTIVFASCHPNGRILDQIDTEKGTPTKADTVLPHKYHVNQSDSVKVEDENVPNRLKR